MKFSQLSVLTLFSLVLTWSACAPEPMTKPACTQSSWVGTYSGSVDCDGTVEDVTVEITASGSEAIVITYMAATFNVQYQPLTPEGCTLSFSETDQGVTISLDGSIDGDELNLVEGYASSSYNSTCTINATRN